MVKVFVAYDDYRYSQGQQVPATRTETLSFAGETVSLDLTDETVQLIREHLADLFKLGTMINQPKKPRGRSSPMYEYYQGLREWAESIGEPVKHKADGTYGYTKAIRERYETHLQEQSRVAGAS